MFDWAQVESFEWDGGNSTKNLHKHGVTCKEAEEMFMVAPLVMPDPEHSATEKRFRALGSTAARRILHAAFAVRGRKIRPISVRPANRKEKAIYENR